MSTNGLRLPRIERHRPVGQRRRTDCHLRALGIGKIDPDPLYQSPEEHQTGDIIVNDTPLDNNLKNIDAVRREVGMVFQQFNLFPHLTVLEKCA